jgi:hypothetical protein
MSSSKPAFIKTRWGDNPKLSQTDCVEWKENMILILSAMEACAIVNGDDPEPLHPDLDRDDIYND